MISARQWDAPGDTDNKRTGGVAEGLWPGRSVGWDPKSRESLEGYCTGIGVLYWGSVLVDFCSGGEDFFVSEGLEGSVQMVGGGTGMLIRVRVREPRTRSKPQGGPLGLVSGHKQNTTSSEAFLLVFPWGCVGLARPATATVLSFSLSASSRCSNPGSLCLSQFPSRTPVAPYRTPRTPSRPWTRQVRDCLPTSDLLHLLHLRQQLWPSLALRQTRSSMWRPHPRP